MTTFFQFLSTSSVALFLVVISVLYCLYVLSRPTTTNTKRTTAPEPAGSWPVIGHLHLLGGRELPHVTLGNMADKYGPAFTIRLGVHRALVVSSPEIAKECFTTKDLYFASRPKAVATKHMGYNYAMFGFAPYGPYWREVRKIATLELLSNHRLEMLKHIRASEVSTSIKDLYELWVNKNSHNGCPVLVEMKQWFADLTLNISVRMITGKRYFGAIAASEEKEARRFQEAIKDFIHLMGLFVVSDAVPFLGWLDFGGYERAMKKAAKELDRLLQEWLEEHKRKKFSGDAQADQDFMDVMLSILEDANFSDYNTDTVIKSTSLETVNLKKRVIWLAVSPRVATEDCTVAGYHVSGGTRLVVNLWKMQRDPSVWSDPSEFRPERFLSSHKDIDVRGHHFELIPFGSGRRVCPGISFALHVVHLTLARLLHCFEPETRSGAPVDMTESPGLTNPKATPLEVLLTPRLLSKLYGY
ncbi:hypothetical protein HHK36_008459 [Tetracentron sinense]|uniref:Cytochrome P450 n=1 Tax=Tetracentron sinense TaxID=13715 RepID=A0A834ZQ75_TETSI|nr:hypothetical protein HHK36_008459 [Tetracentron sinense]